MGPLWFLAKRPWPLEGDLSPADQRELVELIRSEGGSRNSAATLPCGGSRASLILDAPTSHIALPRAEESPTRVGWRSASARWPSGRNQLSCPACQTSTRAHAVPVAVEGSRSITLHVDELCSHYVVAEEQTPQKLSTDVGVVCSREEVALAPR